MQKPDAVPPDKIPAPRQDPALLRRLLRTKDRMDAASQEQWPVKRLAQVSGVSGVHFAHSFKDAFGLPPHRYLLTRKHALDRVPACFVSAARRPGLITAVSEKRRQAAADSIPSGQTTEVP